MNQATTQGPCYILISESAANCFSFALAGVNGSTESHDRKYTAHLSVLSRPAPHLVKARLPAHLSLSLRSQGKQTRPTYTHLQEHLAAPALVFPDVSLKSRSQVKRGEPHALFAWQHQGSGWLSCRMQHMGQLSPTIIGWRGRPVVPAAPTRSCYLRWPFCKWMWLTPRVLMCSLFFFPLYTSYNNVTRPAVHFRPNRQPNGIHWSLKRRLLALFLSRRV